MKVELNRCKYLAEVIYSHYANFNYFFILETVKRDKERRYLKSNEKGKNNGTW